MKRLYIFVLMFVLQVSVLSAYEVSDKYFSMHGIHKGKANFEIESAFDFYGCPLTVNVKNISKVRFSNSCKLIKDKYKGALVCTEKSTRCVRKSHLKKLILKQLNGHGTWYVTKVASNDTLSVRVGAGAKYQKVYNLPYNANNLKVLTVKMNGATTWYKIKYQNVIGWVSSKYLNCKES